MRVRIRRFALRPGNGVRLGESLQGTHTPKLPPMPGVHDGGAGLKTRPSRSLPWCCCCYQLPLLQPSEPVHSRVYVPPARVILNVFFGLPALDVAVTT